MYPKTGGARGGLRRWPKEHPRLAKKDQTQTVKNDFPSLAPQVSGLGGPTLRLRTGRLRVKVFAWVLRGIRPSWPGHPPPRGLDASCLQPAAESPGRRNLLGLFFPLSSQGLFFTPLHLL